MIPITARLVQMTKIARDRDNLREKNQKENSERQIESSKIVTVEEVSKKRRKTKSKTIENCKSSFERKQAESDDLMNMGYEYVLQNINTGDPETLKLAQQMILTGLEKSKEADKLRNNIEKLQKTTKKRK